MFTGVRDWVYVQHLPGRYRALRRNVGIALQAILFVTPWIRIGGHPALLVDLPARRVYAFGGVYSPQDTFFLLIFLLMGAFALFLFTSLYGRLWCGYACPQTVFLEEWIRPLENWIEGNRSTRMRRDERAAWTWDWLWRKAAKLTLFAVASVVVSMAFMSYFTPAPELWTGGGGPVDYTLVAAFSAVWFADFAWFREQFCNYLCPYARFQGVLCDEDSLWVTYDIARGEPRSPRAGQQGGCIDCGKCVVVCPQGIDIRDGFQLECIQCGLCADACETVLPKLGHPGLIRYATQAEMEGRERRVARPRTVVYGSALAMLAVTLLFTIGTHHQIEANVNRLQGPLYTIDADGYVRNTFTLMVTNNDAQEPQTYTVTVDGLDGAEVTVPPIVLQPTERRTVPLVVRLPLAHPTERTVPITVHVASDDDAIRLDTTFKRGGEPAGGDHG